jgi:hypothetical protein
MPSLRVLVLSLASLALGSAVGGQATVPARCVAEPVAADSVSVLLLLAVGPSPETDVLQSFNFRLRARPG